MSRKRLTASMVLRVNSAPPPATDSPHWRDRAHCAAHPASIWFPDETAPLAWRKLAGRNATAICDACPVRAECLTTHCNESHGIFGGLHTEERQAWRRLHGLPRPFIHGDEAGAKRHRRAGEEVCPACLAGARRAAIERQAQYRRYERSNA